MLLINALGLSREYASLVVKPGDTVVDATCGKGRDTILLAKLSGNIGHVYAFDIQEKSILFTKELIAANNIINTTLIQDGHENIDEYVSTGITCAMFNLGYLPGTDHSLSTNGKTTVIAIQKAMRLLCVGGIITIVIYQGGDSGFEERDLVIEFCKGINQEQFTVQKTTFENQKNNPPIFICIEKL
ncbi:MAG: methyltransferase domain-containing protein [Clostridiales bacterium]|nr:methyltransferase domain-containing protein [Clostridiales bacterium]